MPIEVKGKYLRVRIKDPEIFDKDTFSTHDVGAKGHTQRIAGVNKRTGKWETQSWRFQVEDVKKGRPSTKALLKKLGYWSEAQMLV